MEVFFGVSGQAQLFTQIIGMSQSELSLSGYNFSLQYNEVLMGYPNETTQEPAGPIKLMLKQGREKRGGKRGEEEREKGRERLVVLLQPGRFLK